MNRRASLQRKTRETDISCSLVLDGSGTSNIQTGIGFFDHMLDQVAKHSLIDIEIQAKGDLHIDCHHTVEDVGLAFGQALRQALGDKVGINRFADNLTPMDECLVQTALDLSGRPAFHWDLTPRTPQLGAFETEATREFFAAAASQGEMTLHMRSLANGNTHHLIEAAFKGFARALGQAIKLDPRRKDVPSSKGLIQKEVT